MVWDFRFTGLENIIFELLDATVVVDNFNKLSCNLSYFSCIVRDCIVKRNVLWPNLLVEFFTRQFNVVVYELARATMYG
jgi:hypothetical protein